MEARATADGALEVEGGGGGAVEVGGDFGGPLDAATPSQPALVRYCPRGEDEGKNKIK
jgi:hypothetical protein